MPVLTWRKTTLSFVVPMSCGDWNFPSQSIGYCDDAPCDPSMIVDCCCPCTCSSSSLVLVIHWNSVNSAQSTWFPRHQFICDHSTRKRVWSSTAMHSTVLLYGTIVCQRNVLGVVSKCCYDNRSVCGLLIDTAIEGKHVWMQEERVCERLWWMTRDAPKLSNADNYVYIVYCRQCALRAFKNATWWPGALRGAQRLHGGCCTFKM